LKLRDKGEKPKMANIYLLIGQACPFDGQASYDDKSDLLDGGVFR